MFALPFSDRQSECLLFIDLYPAHVDERLKTA
jgi:hypothetical protein